MVILNSNIQNLCKLLSSEDSTFSKLSLEEVSNSNDLVTDNTNYYFHQHNFKIHIIVQLIAFLSSVDSKTFFSKSITQVTSISSR